MRVITCYSYKGGAGRTLAAANLALYLANLGFRVVAIDFDFEAPGLDSKFPQVSLKSNQLGMLDLILAYQLREDAPKSISDYCVSVPLPPNIGPAGLLLLIPAGDYTSSDYPSKLNNLRWGSMFSIEKPGIAFLDGVLGLIEDELAADFVIIDSRTGISETAGVCTQVLANEVIMFSSLAAESVKMTSRLAQMISESEVAAALNKRIDVKVVITRVPRPEDLEVFRRRWLCQFGVPEDHLFFLFSSPLLEADEFLAVDAPTRNVQLTANYVELFQSLNFEMAGDRILAKIEQTASTLLDSPEQAERKVRALVALYPCAEAYRTAMRFFQLTQKRVDVRAYANRLLRLNRHDLEAQHSLASTYIGTPIADEAERVGAIRVLRDLDARGEIKHDEGVRLADLLEDQGEYGESFDIAARYMDDETVAADLRVNAKRIAARTAMDQEKPDLALKLALQIPKEELTPGIAGWVMDHYVERNELQIALEIARHVLSRSSSAEMARRLQGWAKKFPENKEVQQLADVAAAKASGERPLFGSSHTGRARRRI